MRVTLKDDKLAFSFVKGPGRKGRKDDGKGGKGGKSGKSEEPALVE